MSLITLRLNFHAPLAKNSPWAPVRWFEAKRLDGARPNDVHRFFHGIREVKEIEVGLARRAGFHHFSHQLGHIQPVLLPMNDDREIRDLAGLNQSESLEQLVGCSQSSRHDDEGVRVLEKKHLSHEKVIERDPAVQVGIRLLLLRKPDIASDRSTAGVLCSAIRRFHGPGSASRHDSEAQAGEALSHFTGGRIVAMILCEPRAAENGDTWPDEVQVSETSDELPKNVQREM